MSSVVTMAITPGAALASKRSMTLIFPLAIAAPRMKP